MKATVKMQLKKQTPGAVQYEEVNAAGEVLKGDAGVLGGLYIRKAALSGGIPQTITVTVEG